jgi:hypothetical protein
MSEMASAATEPINPRDGSFSDRDRTMHGGTSLVCRRDMGPSPIDDRQEKSFSEGRPALKKLRDLPAAGFSIIHRQGMNLPRRLVRRRRVESCCRHSGRSAPLACLATRLPIVIVRRFQIHRMNHSNPFLKV